jgi:hypothetical protein
LSFCIDPAQDASAGVWDAEGVTISTDGDLHPATTINPKVRTVADLDMAFAMKNFLFCLGPLI